MATRKCRRGKPDRQQGIKIWQQVVSASKGLIEWLLRHLLIWLRKTRKRIRSAQAGFVLPTVTMVSLVVVLLTTAMMIRSFDRSRYASNIRVNQALLNAAAPALDRARAKIDALLADPALPQATPSDTDLYDAIANNLYRYTLGDEQPLKLVHDLGDGQGGEPNNTIEQLANGSATSIATDETSTTAWRFPVDTDNNGRFDSYTLYGIYFRSPARDNRGQPNRPRNPLEARTPPLEEAIAGHCAAALGTSAIPTGDGWYKSGDRLKKSFYVYTATVPITTPPTNQPEYEAYKGNQGFSALEVQQQQARIPLSNNAVVYDNDLEISPDSPFRLNGGILTNGNLLAAGKSDRDIQLYQVSSTDSCYYQAENSKIVVGGNVANGSVTADTDRGAVNIHLFNGSGQDVEIATISSTNKSTNRSPKDVGYNTQAYAQRLALLVDAQMNNRWDSDPTVVRQVVEALINQPIINNEATELRQERIDSVRREQLEIYFRNRLRRVPFAEVHYGEDAVGSYTTSNVLQWDNNDLETLRPPDEWIYPTDPDDGSAATAYTGLNLLQLQATAPEARQERGKEKYLGDRLQVGNNLPAFWFRNGLFAGAQVAQEIFGSTWDESSETRYRTTHVHPLTELRVTDRDGFWEQAAAAQPNVVGDRQGGLRIVTGAGVYERRNSFLPPPTYDDPTTTTIENFPTYDDPATTTEEAYPLVWSDTMPMSPGLRAYDNVAGQWSNEDLSLNLPAAATPTIDSDTPQYAKSDLRMRATAVYHYTQDTYDPNNPTDYQTPIACVSSYYDPTDSITARNLDSLADVSGDLTETRLTAGAKSNNGIVYGKPTIDANRLDGINRLNQTTGLFDGNEDSTSIQGKLQYQANLKFPNGRFANEPLREALKKKANNQSLTLSEQSAIDSTICALQILDDSISPDDSLIPHGAIREVAFLNGRQIQAIEADNPDTNPLETFTTDGNPTVAQGDAILSGSYNLSIEQRQPLEIRATVLDIDKLRQQQIAGGLTQEYLLPNSGIIYASRDDALPDLSDKSLDDDDSPHMANRRLLSPNDFKLDPTRRPNGILLTEGSELWRQENFRAEEKGFILASNLPVYIKGNFNLHSGEEFTNLLADDWSNFYTRTRDQINYNFACRPGDPKLPNCTTGDQWRPATVLADAIALLSDNFQFGFRNHGDYDLGNHQGNRESIAKRLRNGFWNNNFVTNGLSSGGLTVGDITPQDADYAASNSNNAVDSSYFNNFVTPVQRRGRFPEYLMEVCNKLPASECRPEDWYVNPATKRRAFEVAANRETFDLKQHPAGTTAQPPAPEYQRYPRRVAFLRNANHVLQLRQINEVFSAVPLGITQDEGRINQFPYDENSARLPRLADNALWFRTTNNTTGDPGIEADITYASNKPLYQMPPSQGGNKLILPDVPDIEGVPTSLNLPVGDQSGSDYAICIRNAVSQRYYSNAEFLSRPPGSGNCPSETTAAINDFYQGLTLLEADEPSTAPTNRFIVAGNLIRGGFLTAQQPLNVYDLPADRFAAGAKIAIDGSGNPDAIFVFKAEGGLRFGQECRTPGITSSPSRRTRNPRTRNRCGAGVEVNLKEVNPNNVFWVIGGELRIENASSGHQLIGNFIGQGNIPLIGANTQLNGRLLGFGTAQRIEQNAAITAVTFDGQPSLVPVLQLHSPDGTPGSDPNSDGSLVRDTRWMMRATDTTYNLVAAAGDTPNRVNTTVAESNGGLPNLMRFLEDWGEETPARMSGSLIQFKRSAYATAPFTTVFDSEPGGIFNYRQAYSTRNGELENDDWGSLPYYIPPQRRWQFDVALLSQPPDLFSQRFTLPANSEPQEFFRQVSRDDEWVQTLMCAAVNENLQEDSIYEKYAVEDGQRPNCPLPISNYQ